MIEVNSINRKCEITDSDRNTTIVVGTSQRVTIKDEISTLETCNIKIVKREA